jgi:hypothetical protein
MHECVLYFFDFVGVAEVSKPTEARTVKVHSQRLVGSYKHVYSHVELLTPDQKWVHDVLLHDVRFCLGRLWFPTEVIFPLGDLLQFV